MHIRSTSDILLKWEDIQNSCILPNWDDMRNIADITKLSETALRKKLSLLKYWEI
jgi:hypothetical protein